MILTALFSQVQTAQDITPALEAYTAVRKQRTHYAQDMSAENGDIIMNRGAFKGMDAKQLGKALEFRWEELWYFDLEKHQKEALEEMAKMKERNES